jgi:hypothetical protein
MNVPNAPTDSLYKFIFVGALLVVLFCFYRLGELRTTMTKEYAEIEFERAHDSVLNQIAHEKFLKDSVTLFREVFRFDSVLKANLFLNPDSIKASLKVESDKNHALYDSLISIANEELAKSVGSQHKSKILMDDLVEDAKDLKTWLIMGLIFVWVGLCFWYLKLQRYQDEIIKSQAIQSRKRASQLDPIEKEMD